MTGDVAVWVLKGTTIAQAVDLGTVPLTWTIAGIGDFDGNGSSDILFTDAAGDVAIWLMETDPNLVKVLSAAVIGNVGTTWSVAHTGDYSGNGKADILWVDTSRQRCRMVHERHDRFGGCELRQYRDLVGGPVAQLRVVGRNSAPTVNSNFAAGAVPDFT